MANRNQTYDPLMSMPGGMSEMDPEQTKGVMQDILRQRISESLDKYGGGPQQPEAYPVSYPEDPQSTTDFIQGMTLAGKTYHEPIDTSANPEAARQFFEMQKAFRRQTGKPLYLTQGNRTIAEQLRAHAGEPGWDEARARKGTHVQGVGYDINVYNPSTGLKGKEGERYKWLQQNAAKYGFSWPGYTTASGRPEWWHWNYNPVTMASAGGDGSAQGA